MTKKKTPKRVAKSLLKKTHRVSCEKLQQGNYSMYLFFH